MLHRITAMLIIGFWLAMTGLLVVREIYPDSTKLNNIPIAHVGRLLFQHEQASELVIRDKQKDVGTFYVQPRVNRQTRDRWIEFHGNIGVTLPGAGKQRISWSGNATMDDAFNVVHLKISLYTYDPIQGIDFDIDTPTNLAKYTISNQGYELEKGSFTMDQTGLTSLLKRAGLPVAVFQSLLSSSQKTMASPEVGSRLSTIKMNGETLSAYVVSVSVSGQTLFEAHVTQLGQVLKANAPALGYKMYPHNYKESD
jgi:hypothetical protein